jgi:hypothetical protein
MEGFRVCSSLHLTDSGKGSATKKQNRTRESSCKGNRCAGSVRGSTLSETDLEHKEIDKLGRQA